MPAKVEMDIAVDAKDVEKMLGKAIDKLKPGNVDKALAEVGVAILKNNKENWGKRWSALADSTVSQKKGKGEPEVRTDKLKKSLTEPGAEGQIHEIADGTLRLGTSVWYGRFQKGTKHQPKRTMMRLTPTVRREIKATLARKMLPGGR